MGRFESVLSMSFFFCSYFLFSSIAPVGPWFGHASPHARVPSKSPFPRSRSFERSSYTTTRRNSSLGKAFSSSPQNKMTNEDMDVSLTPPLLQINPDPKRAHVRRLALSGSKHKTQKDPRNKDNLPAAHIPPLHPKCRVPWKNERL